MNTPCVRDIESTPVLCTTLTVFTWHKDTHARGKVTSIIFVIGMFHVLSVLFSILIAVIPKIWEPLLLHFGEREARSSSILWYQKYTRKCNIKHRVTCVCWYFPFFYFILDIAENVFYALHAFVNIMSISGIFKKWLIISVCIKVEWIHIPHFGIHTPVART